MFICVDPEALGSGGEVEQLVNTQTGIVRRIWVFVVAEQR
jgi:hypothetical protein